MPSFTEISFEKLNRLIGTQNAPMLVDVRNEEDFSADARLIPGSFRQPYSVVAEWGRLIAGPTVVICDHGAKLSHGVAAHLRTMGIHAEALEGGFKGWIEAGGLAVPETRIPPRDKLGRTVWVTRARPKIDRIACPWLIRRFVDPTAVFLFVPTSEVSMVGDRFGATPFDIEDVFWSHRGDQCSFDTMIEEFGLRSKPLMHLATIVRAADTAKLDLAAEAAGLLAASLGLSRMFTDDLEQLDAGMVLYDAFYRWCRDATEETHNWPSAKKGA
jgi:rhodanese-related sulfurtransferase